MVALKSLLKKTRPVVTKGEAALIADLIWSQLSNYKERDEVDVKLARLFLIFRKASAPIGTHPVVVPPMNLGKGEPNQSTDNPRDLDGR